jgi:hypothetical protein
MADEFRLQADELLRVSRGLRDVESRLSAAVSRLRGQLGASGAPWHFPGGPAGVGANLEKTQRSVDPSLTAGVAGLAEYVQEIVNTFTASDG